MNDDSVSDIHGKLQRLSRKKARTRADLLMAAREVFATRGFHEASIAEITDKADVGVGTFYLHFRDKDEIFHTLIEEGLRAIREQVTAAAMQYPHEQMCAAIIRLTFRYAHEQRDLFRIAMMGGGMLERKFRAHTPLIEGFTMIFERAQENHLLAGIEVPLLARFVAGMVTQGIAWWFENDEPGPDEMAEQVIHLLHHGLPASLLIEKNTSS